LRSREFGWLLGKDARLLLSSRSYPLLLLAAGLLVGQAFQSAVATYAEMSGSNGGPAALAEGLSPLEGMVTPTFGALTLVATLLLPFVAIRLVGHERQNGAWKLLAQGPLGSGAQLLSKVAVLLLAWLAAWLPAFGALLLWRVTGNHLDGRELLAVMLGQGLFAWLTMGVATMAAAVTATEASAAIITLGFTIGTWALDFLGAARGGTAAEVARFTPTAVLRSFEHGLIRVDAVLVMLVVGTAAIWVAAIWLAPGRRDGSRWLGSAMVAGVTALALLLAGGVHASRDVSENRQNSFAVADEAALRSIRQPLQVEVHLAPEDPRLEDLRRGVLEKLERLLPNMTVTMSARTRTGMFEQADPHYGESWYQVGNRRAMTHSATPAIVLETIYQVAGIPPPAGTESSYPGYPLVRAPGGIAGWFFVAWPLLLLTALVVPAVRSGRRRISS
jgi:hypothetical protein